MDVTQIYQLLAEMGIPEDFAQRKLSSILQDHGQDDKTISADKFREIISEFAQDVLLEFKESLDLVEAEA